MDHEHQNVDTAAAETATETPLPVGAGRKTIRQKPEGRLPKILRVAALAAVLGGAFAAFSIHRVHGQIGESLLGAGPEMMMLADAQRQDAPRELVLNGQRVRFSSGMAPYSPRELLDRFEARCESVDADLMAQFSEIVAQHPESESARSLDGLSPVLREEQNGHGYVACLDLGAERQSLDAILQRAHRFTETRDLHDFGDLRYVYAEPASAGPAGEERTHFVAFWTEGSLRFDELFPETGDAPGRDPADIPRPPAARRVLIASEHGIDDVATIYAGSELDEGQLESFYRRELPATGWTILDASDDPRVRDDIREVRPALIAQRGDQLAYFALSTDLDGTGRAAVVTTGEGMLSAQAAPPADGI